MLNELFKRQAAIQAEVDKYVPIREVFEEFLKTGQRQDAGFFWMVSIGARHSRYSWERKEVLDTADGRRVAVEAFTDPMRYKFGWVAGNIPNALIDIIVSLPGDPIVARKLRLPPVWAILEQYSDFSPLELDRLGKDLEEIVPLVRALLPQS